MRKRGPYDEKAQVISDDTILDTGNYFLFYKSDQAGELGKASGDVAGSAKYTLRVDQADLASCGNLSWSEGEDGEEKEPFYVSEEQTETTLDLSDAIEKAVSQEAEDSSVGKVEES